MSTLMPLLTHVSKQHRGSAKKYVADRDINTSKTTSVFGTPGAVGAVTIPNKRRKKGGRKGLQYEKKYHDYEKALRRRDFCQVLWMITNGDIPVNYETKTGETALLAAVSAKNLDALTTLMKSGVSIDTCTRRGYTPLMKAIAVAVPLHKFPLKHDRDQDLSISRNNNIEDLKSADTDVTDTDTSIFDNVMIESVLKYEPNLMLPDLSGKTAFDWAKLTGNIQALELLEKYQQERSIRYQSLANYQARMAECLELLKHHEEYIERIEALIAPQFFDETELIKFLKTTTISAAEFAGAIRDLQSSKGSPGLLLLKTKFFVDTETREGWTPLTKCAAFGYVVGVQELLAMGANLHYETRLRHTAMTWACYCGHEAVCLYLLRFGVNLNQTTRGGKTALLHAITNSQAKIVHHLLVMTRDQCFPLKPIDTFSKEGDAYMVAQPKAKLKFHLPDSKSKEPNLVQIEWHRAFLKKMRWQDHTGQDALRLAQHVVKEESLVSSDLPGELSAKCDSESTPAIQVLRQVETAIQEAQEHKLYVEKHEESTKLTKCRHDGCSFMAPKDVISTHEHHHCMKRTIACEQCGEALIFEERGQHDDKLCPMRQVACTNYQFGCQERVLFQDRENHRNHHCRKREVQCRLMCGATLRFDELDRHETHQCPVRKVACDLGCPATFRANLAKGHRIHDCPKRLVSCTGEKGGGGCGELVVVEEMAFHMSNLCEMRGLRCKWSVYGCEELVGGVASSRHYHETNECLFRPASCRNGCELSGHFLACFTEEHYRWQCMLETRPCPNECHDRSITTILPTVQQLPEHILMVHGLQDVGDCPLRKTHCPLDMCGKHIRLYDTDQTSLDTLKSGDYSIAKAENRTICLKAMQDHVNRYTDFLQRIQRAQQQLISADAESKDFGSIFGVIQKPLTMKFLVNWLCGIHKKLEHELNECMASRTASSRICRVLTFEPSKQKHLIEFPDGHSIWLALNKREYDFVASSDKSSADSCTSRCGLLESNIIDAHIANECCHRLIPCPLKCGQRLPARAVEIHLSTRCNMRNEICHLGCGEVMPSVLLAEHEEEQCKLRSTFCEFCHASIRVQLLLVHLDKECQLRPRSCKLGCSLKVAWSDAIEHESNQCSKRLISCKICNNPIWFCEREVHEAEECPLRVHGDCSAGCGQTLRHNEVAHHLLHACTKRLVNCKHCKQQLKFSDLPEHHKLLCPQRVVSCQKGCGVTLTNADVDVHENEECSKRLLFCTNQCGLHVPCSEMEEHLQSQCPMRVMQCPTGCREWIFAYLHEDHWKRCRQRVVPCGVGGKLCARPIRVWHQGDKLIRCAVHGESALLWAVRSQDLDLVTYLLQNVDAINAVNEEFTNGFSPLVLASSLGNLDLIQLLLRFGADVNLETSRGRTPLAEACMALDPSIVRLLIDHRASVSHTNRQGRNLLELVRAFEATAVPAPTDEKPSRQDQVSTSLSKWKEIIRLLEDQAALERDQRDLFIAISCSDYDYIAQCLKHNPKASSQASTSKNIVESLRHCVIEKEEQAAKARQDLTEAINVFNESIAETETKRVRTVHLSSQVEDSYRRMQNAEKAAEASEADSNALEADMLSMIREITAQDIAQLLNAHVPSESTLVVIKALSMLCGVLPRGRRNATEYTDVEWWKTSQALLMDRGLLRRLRGYRQQPITPDVMSKVRRECLKSPAFVEWSTAFKDNSVSFRNNTRPNETGERTASSQIPPTDTLRGDIVGVLATWVQGVELEYKARSERQVLVERKRQLEVAYTQAQEKHRQASFEAKVAARSLPARQEEMEVVRVQSDAAEKDLVAAKNRLHNYKLLNYAALSGHTPLTFACAVGNEAMVHMLLSHGANSGHHFDEQTLCASFIQVLVRDYQYRKKFESEQSLQEKCAGGVKHGSDAAIEALVRNVAHTFIVGHFKRKLMHFRQTHRVALHEAVFNGNPEIAATLLSKDARVWQKTYVLPERVYPGAPFESIAAISRGGHDIVKRSGGWKLQPLGKTHDETSRNTEIEAERVSELGDPMTLADTLHCATKHYDCRLFKLSSGWEPPLVSFYSSTAQFVNGVLERIREAKCKWEKELAARKNVIRKTAELRVKHEALEKAIISRNFCDVSKALDDGAFADYETSREGLSALMVACIEELYVQNGDRKDVLAVEYLLNRTENRPLVNFESSCGFTALGTAAFYGTLKCAQVLLECRANVNLASRRDGRTALMVAAGNGKESFVRFLLAHPDIDVFKADATGRTALEYACSGGFVNIAGLLGAAMGGNRGRVVTKISGLYGVCKWGCGFMTPVEGHRVVKAQVIRNTNPLEEHETQQCPKRHVLCPNTCGAGDLWAEELRDHLAHTCALRIVHCTNQKCSMRFPFAHRENHLRDECEFRMVVCVCGESMTYQRQVGHLNTQCPKRLVPCPLKCQDTFGGENTVFELQFQDVKAHVTGDCPHRNVRCRNGCIVSDLLLKNREYHETTTCALRRVACKWGCTETVIAKTQDPHERDECELRQMSCPNRCGQTDVPAIEMEEHVSAKCTRRLTVCPLGCGLRVPLRIMEAHTAHECRKRTIECTLCHQAILDEERATHQSTKCPLRITVCGLCGQANLLHSQMAQHRSEECKMRQVSCKYQCFVKMLLAHEKEHHEMWECSFRPIWCPLGCGDVFVCNTLKKHQRTCSMRFVTCGNGCGEELREKDRAEHEQNYCSLKKPHVTISR